jgi:UDP-3-O-[3-hydroxymyristoyl] glucosamine N-acyltransferase
MAAVTGVSYIGRPRPGTAMYVTRKVGHLCANLSDVSGCLVFAEEGVEAPADALAANEFRFSDNPLLAYVEFARGLEREREERERAIPYVRTASGALVSEAAAVGEGARLEASVIVGPGVTIGRDATVLAGAVIRHATIGDRVVINEHAVIGAQGFTMARDASGDLVRIPTLGGVAIGDDVEVGAHDNVSCGSGGDTVIRDHAKLDALVHVGHDACIGKNVEVTAGVVVGGVCEVGDDAFVGVGAVLRNRIAIGEGATVGMGAVVTKGVDDGATVVGNPARPFERRK